MRKQKVRTAELLSKAVEAAFAEIHEWNCIGYFCAYGYVR